MASSPSASVTKTYGPRPGELDTSVHGQMLADSRMAFRDYSRNDNSLWRQKVQDDAAFGGWQTEQLNDLRNQHRQATVDMEFDSAAALKDRITALEKSMEQHWTDRVGNIGSGALKQWGGSMGSSLATSVQAGQTNTTRDMELQYESRKKRYEKMLEENKADPGKWSQQVLDSYQVDLERMESMLSSGKKAVQGNALTQGATKLREATSGLSESGARDIEQAKAGLGSMGKFAVDVAAGGLQLGLDIAAGAVTHAGVMPVLAARVYGSAADEAAAAGASLDQQVTYGLASAATEMLLEKISSVGRFQKTFFGAGKFDDVANSAIAALEDLAKTDAGKVILNRVGTAGASFLSEGFEEGMAAVIDPFLAKAIYSDEELELGTLVKDALYEALVGGMIGMISGGVGGTDTSSAHLGRGVRESNGVDQLIQTAMHTDKNGAAYQMVDELRSRKGEASDKEIGDLVKLTAREIVTEARTAAEAASLAREAELGSATEIGELTVLDRGTTAYMNLGMKHVKKAEAKAKVVQDLIDGKNVDRGKILSLNLQHPKYQAVFTELTGVTFEGCINDDQRINRAKTANQVAESRRAVEAQEIAAEEAADVADVAEVQEAQMAEASEELLPTLEEFTAFRQARSTEQLSPEQVQADYDAFVARERETIVDEDGETRSRNQFRARAQAADPDLTPGAVDAYFDRVRDAQKQTDLRGKLSKDVQDVIAALEKKLGVSIKVVESVYADQARRFAEGESSRSGILVALDARGGLSYDEAVLQVLRHELTHQLEKLSPEAYGKFAAYVKEFDSEFYEKQFKSVSETYEDEFANTADPDELNQRIEYEVIARCAEKLFDDRDFARMVTGRDPTLAEMIRDLFNRLLKKLNLVGEAKKQLEAKRDLWAAALEGASLAEAERDTGSAAAGEDVQHSIASLSEAMGILSARSENGQITFTLDGTPVSRITADHIRENSGIGLLIKTAVENGFITGEDATRQFEAAAELMNTIIRTEDPEMVWAYAGATMFSALKANADGQYGTTVDFTTVCRKTQDMVSAMSHAMVKLRRGLTKEEIVQLQAELLEENSPVPCPVCYVFSRWAGVGSILDNMYRWQNTYENYTLKQIADRISELRSVIGEKADLRRMLKEQDQTYFDLSMELERNEQRIKDLRSVKKNKDVKKDKARVAAIADEITSLTARNKEIREEKKKIEASGAPELAWLEQVRNNPEYAEKGHVPAEVLFNLDAGDKFSSGSPLAWAYRTSRGPSAGKAIVPYSDMVLGDLIGGLKHTAADGDATFKGAKGKLTKAQQTAVTKALLRTRAQNLIGGQRFQSTSDFRYEYALDYIQAFWELQALGSNIQTYTKIVEFAEFIASVGGDVNLSVMPKDKGYADGKLIYSNVTGVDFEGALKVAQMFDNAQLILVGVNDEHIRLALEDSSETGGIHIGFVIPYHASGASDAFISGLVQNLGETYVAKTYTDYSKVQSDSALGKLTPDQIRRNNLRAKLLKGTQKVELPNGKTSSRAWAPTDEDLRFMERESKKAQSIEGRSFEDLREVEKRALAGDADAIQEYKSWTADALWNLYNKMWNGGPEDGVRLNSAQAKAVMPHEYWNKSVDRSHAYINGFLFRSYCYNLGLKPRFTGITLDGKYIGDFSDSPGYWKTLIDRPMYANDGAYRDQQKINVTDFNQGMLTPDYAEEHWGEYKVAEPDLNRAQRAAENWMRKNSEDATPEALADAATQYSLVEDGRTLNRLNDQEWIKVYRAMWQDPDTEELYPPMGAIQNGKLVDPIVLKAWYKSDENPQLIKFEVPAAYVRGEITAQGKPRKGTRFLTAEEMEANRDVLYGSHEPNDIITLSTGKTLQFKALKPKFELKKADGGTDVPAAYNPYFHTSLSALNDQFSSAYKRPGLVVVEGYIPAESLDGKYRAVYAKDPVGETTWNSGPVADKLKGDKARKVYLSQYFRAERVVKVDEAAPMIAQVLKGEDIKVPWNVVTPDLRKALAAEGVEIDYDTVYMGTSFEDAFPGESQYSFSDSNYDRAYALDLFVKYGKAEPVMFKEVAAELEYDSNASADFIEEIRRFNAKTASDTEIMAMGEKLLDFYDRSDEPFTWYGVDLNRADSLNEQRNKDAKAAEDRIQAEYEKLRDSDKMLFTLIRAGVVDPNKRAIGEDLRKFLDMAGAQNATRYSFSDQTDSNGKQLTKEQQEFFKDSKVRDAEGRLRVVYHSTDADFTVFDVNKDLYGEMYYFAQSRTWSKNFHKAEKNHAPKHTLSFYLNLTNPFEMREAPFTATGNEWIQFFESKGINLSDEFKSLWSTPQKNRLYYGGGSGRGIIPGWFLFRYDGITGHIRESLVEAGYDGVALKDAVHGTADNTSYVCFNKNQIKRTGNKNPTEDPDIRYSFSDSTGKQLTKEQQEYFKDSKIRDENGNLRAMWHGTASDFTVFDIEKAGANWGGDSRLGKGFYFTDNEQDALRWTEGTKVVKAYLNITNPLDVDAPAPQNIAEEIDKYIANKVASFDESNSFISKEQYVKNLQRIKEMYMNDVSMFVTGFKYDDTGKMTDGVREFLSALGYDGIVSKDETVAFYPEQIKLTSNEKPTADKDIRYSLADRMTPELREEFVKSFDAEFGEGAAEKMFKTHDQMVRAARRAGVRAKSTEESAAAERALAKRRMENAMTAWDIYHKRTLRDQQRKYADAKAKATKEKAEAVARAVEVERAKADIKVQTTEMNLGKKAAERERTLKDRMSEMKDKAAERLHLTRDAYKGKLAEKTKLQRRAAKQLLSDKKAVEKRRNEIQTQQGPVNTIRQNPRERVKVEKLKAAAEELRTRWRATYRAFVNMAQEIDNFAKRQKGGVYASTLVNIIGGSGSTTETIFKRGLVDRSGRRIGASLKEVLLCTDSTGKKVDEAKQALLQDYILHLHNIDRMSFVSNARARLEAFEGNPENAWLVGLAPKDLAILVAATDAEVADSTAAKLSDHGKVRRAEKGKSGWTEADRQLAREYASLQHNFLEAKDKPVFADENGNPVTAETSREIVAKYEAENPWLMGKANGVFEWWDLFMRTWAVGDSLSLAEYETMHQTYPHYAPTYRVGKGGPGGAASVSNRAATVSKATKAAKGSTLEIVPIEDSYAAIASKIIRLARVNELYMNIIDTAMLDEEGLFSDMAAFDWDWHVGEYAKALQVQNILDGETAEEIEAATKVGLEQIGKDYKLTGWKDGRKYSAYISADLYKSIADVTGFSTNEVEEILLKSGRALTGPMKMAITGINPAFVLRNVFRDLPTAVINSSGPKFLKYYKQAWIEMARQSDNWQVFQALGGTNGTYYNNEKGFGHSMTAKPGAVSLIKSGLEWFGNGAEAATRFAEYLSTIDRMGDTYEARLQGVKNAAEVTVDFSRAGRLGRDINAWVPYWNPAVQGVDKLIRSVVSSPEGAPIWKQAMKTGSRAVMSTVLFEAVLQGVLRYFDRDDEWEQLSDRDKAAYYCIPLWDEHKFLKIPKNREWGAILGTPFMLILEGLDGRQNPFENYVETALEPNFMPPAILRPNLEDGGFDTDIIGISWMQDLSKNKDFAGRTIVPYALEQGSLSEQFNDETSLIIKELAQLINLSPMQMQYIIKDYFGDFGETFAYLTSPAFLEAEKSLPEAMASVAGTFFGSFVGDNRYSNYGVSKYYDTLDELGRVVNDKKNQMGNEAYKDTKEYKTQKGLQELYGDQITDLNKQVRELPDGPDKDALKEEIAQLAGQALEFYEKSMSGEVAEPQLTATYANLPASISNELIRLNSFAEDYSFAPTDNKPSSYTDPKDKKREYVLDDEAKTQYRIFYDQVYAEVMEEEMNRYTYQKVNDQKKAEMLEEARDSVTEITKDRFLDWLADNRRSTEKSK